jgi:hypothetical protein|eukprot:COSAG06_NODE_5138_length_3687_cov_4.373467_5_plen_42_part_00
MTAGNWKINPAEIDEAGEKAALLVHVLCKYDQFTKTGSGQT